MLPLAALCEDNILCVHGGLGPSVVHVNDIVDIKRPLSPFNNTLVHDLLFSDYVENNLNEGNKTNCSFSEKKVD